MAIEKMKFVMVNGPSSQLDKMISALCTDGAFHPEPAAQFISPTMGYAAVSEENPYAATLAALRDLSTQLGVDLEPHDKKLKGTVIDERARAYVDTLSQTLRDLAQQRRTMLDQIETCRGGIEEYKHFCGLGVNLEEIFACRFISIRFGHLPKDSYIKLMKGYADHPYVLFYPCSGDADGYWGAYFAPKDREDDVDRIFAALHFNRLHVPSAVGTAEEIIDSLNESIRINEEQLGEIDAQMRAVWNTEGEKIRTIYTKLLDRSAVFELRKYAVHHEGNCFFVGWIPASEAPAVRKKLERYPEFVVEVEDPEEENTRVKPPTRLKNFKFVRPYSYFVEMYGVPSYRDLDITAFVALTYTLLFGIMFGDLGQGLVLILVGLLMWKFKSMPLGKILVPCGCSSMVFGFIFGSVFGYESLLDPVYEKLGMRGKPLSVMDSINSVLLFAISIGVTLVIVAMVLNVVSCIKKRKLGSALFSENGVTGICVYVGAASLAYSFMAKSSVHLPHQFLPSAVSVALLVIGILILFNKELIAGSIDEGHFKKPESLMDYLLQNTFECIEYILSYFSNTVSFLRVGAFVIVHASMMMVVFTLAGGEEAAMTPKGIVIVAIGNVVVIALEGLLSGIQGLRLEFYEMFSRFYEGEGRAFEAVELK